ncbi:uncharacterized protein LOC124275499 [Haliotis rubra]|uniref:uncharacterized protein LOC124275499 n=1 Tax=Haliotis rubra TaxID=36100 RepID=UPI001EE60F63|nr:uncharacterized protein LOC124275499 [Haliotis rubra]
MTTSMTDCFVTFFVVGKVIGVNRYEVIVGCLEPNEIYLCLDDWKQKSFVTLAVSGKFASLERQSYRFQVEGKYEFLGEYNDHLERTPREANYRSLLVEVSQCKDASLCGCINIYTAGDHKSRLVTQLPLPLIAEIEASPRVEAPWPMNKNRRHVLNSFFVSVVKDMTPDITLFKELGLSDDEIKRICDYTSCTDTEYSGFMMLDKCREKERDNATFLKTLVVALGKVQQNNVKLLLVENIRHWLAVSTPDEDDETFAKELSSFVNDFKGQGLITPPGDYRNTTYIETTNFKEASLRNVDIRFGVQKRVGAEKTFLRLTYSEPEDNPYGLVAKMDEAFFGDLIEWCISTPSIDFAIVFHLEEGPGRYSELILRYATIGHKQEEAPVDTVFIQERQRWEATTQITVGPRGWFVLCTRPKETLTEVPVDGCTVVYELDERVQIHIPKNAFECPGSMILKTCEDQQPNLAVRDD